MGNGEVYFHIVLFTVQIMDYDFLDTTLQFAECERMSCVNITINEDETLENIESFFVTLERNGLDSSITLNPTRAEIEIRDDDGGFICNENDSFLDLANDAYRTWYGGSGADVLPDRRRSWHGGSVCSCLQPQWEPCLSH